MKVAAIQINANADKEKNIKKALALAGRAAKNKAKLIVLPEVFNYRGSLADGKMSSIAERLSGQSIAPFLALAKEKKIFILLGSVYEKTKKRDKAYNTSVFIDNKGKIKAKYRKINLFDAVIGKKRVLESKHFVPGKKLSVAEAEGFTLGLSICYDLRFPELYDKYSKRGCDVFLVPSSFTKKTGKAHWEVLLRARAIENRCYVIAPNQIGKNFQGVESYGNSMIVSPWGKILARASGKKEEIIYAGLTTKALLSARRMLPALKKGEERI